MAPIKFEEQLKDKLEKRTLQPSVDSWAKLSDRLDTEEKKSKNPWFWWMGIAAGLIIMLAIVVQFFGSNQTDNTLPILVEEDVKENKVEKQLPSINNTDTIELAIEDEQEEINKTEEQPEIINYKSVTHKKQKANTQLANTDKTKDEKTKVIEKTSVEQQTIINPAEINKDAVANAIKNFKSENISVTDREVDSLLKLASKELFKDKLKKKTSKTVDANSLLQDVEDEMGQSFRTKVFEALKDSYKTVKTAVAERNN